MSDQSGSFNKFLPQLFVQAVLVIALIAYMALAKSHEVGADFAFTSAGVGLMALVTYWTLTTVRDGIEMLATRTRVNHS